ncbi:hypothetical protein [Phascolarctobacterium faecium]|uniref:hypothetical protein n=1 Tax=Phascolarctobacterium faecium TaxID=33025 RepID=UPI002664F788|nr:hypothetical protein [Phascolarctobacterium faecium]
MTCRITNTEPRIFTIDLIREIEEYQKFKNVFEFFKGLEKEISKCPLIQNLIEASKTSRAFRYDLKSNYIQIDSHLDSILFSLLSEANKFLCGESKAEEFQKNAGKLLDIDPKYVDPKSLTISIPEIVVKDLTVDNFKEIKWVHDSYSDVLKYIKGFENIVLSSPNVKKAIAEIDSEYYSRAEFSIKKDFWIRSSGELLRLLRNSLGLATSYLKSIEKIDGFINTKMTTEDFINQLGAILGLDPKKINIFKDDEDNESFIIYRNM